ncbi:MAG: glycosyltransferase [Bacteroidota bacterium]
MKIVHINTKDTGGAAVACIRLHLSLLQMGVCSKLLTKKKTRNDIPEHYSYEEEFSPSLIKKVDIFYKQKIRRAQREERKKFLQSINRDNGPFSFIETDERVESLSIVQKADIIQLHWVAKFINWETFFAACSRKVIIWTLHDMFPFTGGYHYAQGFEGYKYQDQNYPMLKNSLDPQMAQKILSTKKGILGKLTLDLTLVAPSQWLYQCSLESALFSEYDHYCIPYGVDTDIFKMNSQRCCREVLELPPDKHIILFISQNINVKRKGFSVLQKSLTFFEDKQAVILCSVGKSTEALSGDHHISFGSIKEERYLSIVYNAADVFVIPTLEDNLPNVVLEALSCGTPVIGFNVGGIKDMVKPGFNGDIASETSAKRLYDTIAVFLENKKSFSRQAIREDATERYALSVQAQAYLLLYREKVTQS